MMVNDRISSVKLPEIKSGLNSLVKTLSIRYHQQFIFVGIEITAKRKLGIILLKKTEVSSCLLTPILPRKVIHIHRRVSNTPTIALDSFLLIIPINTDTINLLS